MSYSLSRLNQRRPTLRRAVMGAAVGTLGAVVGSAALAPSAGAAAPNSSVVHVSDLTPIDSHGAWGPVELDRSNGEQKAFDGRVLVVDGRPFGKGLGAHAWSEITFAVPAGCTRFTSTIGVDDEVGNRGSVRFHVFEDGRQVFQSRRLTGRSAARIASVTVTPGASLRLMVSDAGDGMDFDHADWAGAAFRCAEDAGRYGGLPLVPEDLGHDVEDWVPDVEEVVDEAEDLVDEAEDLVDEAEQESGTSSAQLVEEGFAGPDGEFVSARSFWGSPDRGTSQNTLWFSEAGELLRQDEAGTARADYFRMWTRMNDLQHVQAELDVTFRGFTSGTAGWHGINLWLHKQMCTPVPSCSAVNDPDNNGGNSGYVLDFMNRDGSLTILKKVSGDTRSRYAGAVSHAQGGTYYQLAQSSYRPTAGQRYRFAGRSIDNGDGTTTLQVLVDGQLRLSVRDDGRVGGPRLGAGRVGLRSDFVDMTVDNVVIRR